MNIQNNCLFSKQVEISNTLRKLWMEHVLWTRFFIVSTAFELPDLSCTGAGNGECHDAGHCAAVPYWLKFGELLITKGAAANPAAPINYF